MANTQALTPAEKRERNMARIAAAQQEATTGEAPIVRTTQERDGAAATRRTRGAFNGTTGKLSLNSASLDPAFHYHWINDTPGRVAQAEANGYQFVLADEVGSEVVRLVGVQESGEPLKSYLMKIKMEWYMEDQAALQGKLDKVDSAIKSGRNAQDSDGFYDAGIKVGTSNRF